RVCDSRATPTTELYTLSLHDALPIYSARVRLETPREAAIRQRQIGPYMEQEIILPWAQILLGLRAEYVYFDVENLQEPGTAPEGDRKSTRLNSSHVKISYAVFCLKKK